VQYQENTPARDLSDQFLLSRFRQGHEDAATELYRRYADRLHNLAARKCSGDLAARIDADDIVQSVFCAFFQGAREGFYDVPGGEDLWRLIVVIGLNKVREKRAFHQAAKRDVRLTASAEHLESHCGADDPGHALQLAFKEALAHLDSSERQMAELLVEGHEVAEIAARVRRSKRTVERNLQTIRRKLSRLLEGSFSHGS